MILSKDLLLQQEVPRLFAVGSYPNYPELFTINGVVTNGGVAFQNIRNIKSYIRSITGTIGESGSVIYIDTFPDIIIRPFYLYRTVYSDGWLFYEYKINDPNTYSILVSPKQAVGDIIYFRPFISSVLSHVSSNNFNYMVYENNPNQQFTYTRYNTPVLQPDFVYRA